MSLLQVLFYYNKFPMSSKLENMMLLRAEAKLDLFALLSHFVNDVLRVMEALCLISQIIQAASICGEFRVQGNSFCSPKVSVVVFL